jgi:hypothetical protein
MLCRAYMDPLSSLTPPLPPPPRHLVVTVSNPRVGKPIADTESLFVPFKGQFEDAGGAVAGTRLTLPVSACCDCVVEDCLRFCFIP